MDDFQKPLTMTSDEESDIRERAQRFDGSEGRSGLDRSRLLSEVDALRRVIDLDAWHSAEKISRLELQLENCMQSLLAK